MGIFLRFFVFRETSETNFVKNINASRMQIFPVACGSSTPCGDHRIGGPKCIDDKTHRRQNVSVTKRIGDKGYRGQNVSETKRIGDETYQRQKVSVDKMYL